MATRDIMHTDGAELRCRAEERLSDKMTGMRLPVTEEEQLRLIHELQVHQIELELQNAELMHARDEVERSLEKYTDLYDFAPVGYFTLDGNGTILAANLTGATLLGIDRSRLIGRRFGQYVSHEARRMFTDFLKKVFAGKEKEACEAALTKEGNYRLFARIEAGAGSSDDECRVVVSDISASKWAEVYEQQFYFLQRLIDTIPSPIFYKDVQGKFLGCNASFEALIGKKKRDIIGNTLHDKTMSEAAGILQNIDYALNPEPGVLRYETHLTDNDGRSRDFILDVATFPDHTGKVAGSIEVMTDITGRKELERLEDEMISGVNYEMRTPLTVLLGYLQYLSGNRVDEPHLGELIATMLKEAECLKGQIDNFLNLQQLRANKGDFSHRPLAVKSLLEEVASLFAGASKAHRITIDTPAELPQVIGSRERLREVISNLLSNAIKYSPDGGVVVLGAKPEGDGVTIWVKDEGIGIPRESLDKIFDTFYRVDNTARHLFRGTGLGLALVQEIVKSHEGRVWADSTVGKGSTFYIALPAMDSKRRQS